MGKALPVLVLLTIFLVRGCLSCGAKPIVTGNSFCATQQCTHIYNFRPCSYWNPAQCTCSGSTATCPSGYTADSDGTKCYILVDGREHNEQLLKLDQWTAHHPRQPGLCRDAFQLRLFRPVGSCGLQQDRHQLRLRAQTNWLVGTIERKQIINLMQAKK